MRKMSPGTFRPKYYYMKTKENIAFHVHRCRRKTMKVFFVGIKVEVSRTAARLKKSERVEHKILVNVMHLNGI